MKKQLLSTSYLMILADGTTGIYAKFENIPSGYISLKGTKVIETVQSDLDLSSEGQNHACEQLPCQVVPRHKQKV